MTITQEGQLIIEDGTREELIDGKLILSPRPASKHILVVARLTTMLSNAFDLGSAEPSGWWILPEPEVLFIRNKFVPDICGWRKEKQPSLPEGNPLEEIPDWVCEVVSLGSRKLDHQAKPPVYHQSKVSHFWRLEPDSRSLQAFRWMQAGWLLIADVLEDDKVKIEPFDVLELDLSRLWV